MDFILFDDVKEYYSCYHFRRDGSSKLYSDKMEIHIIELPKLKNYEEQENELLDWLRFFDSEDKKEMERLAEKNEHINTAYERLLHLSEDDKKKIEYEQRMKAIRDHNYLMNQSLKEGWKKGHTEGRIDKLREQVTKKKQRGQSVEEIAEDLLEEVDVVRKIYEEV